MNQNLSQITIVYNHNYQQGVYTPPTVCTFQQNNVVPLEQHCLKVNVTISPTLMKFVIGKNGYYFNAITKASGTNYIWYKREEGIIEIWGPPHKLVNAKDRLEKRMKEISWKAICKESEIKPGEKWGDIED